MKLTLKQISKLSDTELNRAMIWLYSNVTNMYQIVMHDDFIYVDYDSDNAINYLSDYNLTMPLAFSNWLTIGFFNDSAYVDSDGLDAVSANPLRAICEVLVVIALERDK